MEFHGLRSTLDIDVLSNMHWYNMENFDDAVLMDAFGMAYGMEWMENYYRKNESQIIASIYARSIPGEMK